MLALTVRQPWAWTIIHAGKDVENRTWPTNYRGPLAIHAATKMWRGDDIALNDIALPPEDEFIRGAVIGIVDVTDCVQDSRSRWAVRAYWHWLLANPRALPQPVPYRGQPGLFQVALRF